MEQEPWEDALDQCEMILDMIDEDFPDHETAIEFGESIKEKVSSIMGWIDKHEEVTPNQQTALDNMEAGVRRWIR